MTLSRIPLLMSAAFAASLLASPAMAQIGRSDAPIEITSDKTEYLQNEGRGLYTGNVIATQGDSRITTDRLTFVCTKSKPAAGEEATCQEIEQLVAEPHDDDAVVERPQGTATVERVRDQRSRLRAFIEDFCFAFVDLAATRHHACSFGLTRGANREIKRPGGGNRAPGRVPGGYRAGG